jgi:imidazolonepropionase-like amidohydrolase
VDSLVGLGVDFIKLHEMVPPDAFFALARAARTRGITLAGHLNAGVTVEQAADSGQKSLEHLSGFLNPCSAADSVRLSAAHALVRYTMSECGSGDQSSVYRHMAASRTWVTPTLVALEMMAALPGPPPADSLARYEPKFLREAMAAALELPPDMPANSRELGYALWGKRLQVVKALQQNGVHLLAGTDAPLPNSIPGFGMHAELEAMVRAGLTPLEALRTATVEPARYFAADSLGGLCAGCVADLVLLTADPLKDIRNTTRISRVIANGRVYTTADLAALREQALKAAQ